MKLVRFQPMAPLLYFSDIYGCMSHPITLRNQTYNKSNTFNPETPDQTTDGLSVLCFGNVNTPIDVAGCTIDGQDARWGGKHSLTFDSTYTNCYFKNGTARAFDMVRGGKITFNECKFLNEGTRPVVKSPYFTLSENCDVGIKGGVHDITFNNCELNDVLLGDYTIYDQQDRPKTRRVTFNNCKNPNGGPIIVRGRWFEPKGIQKINTSVNAWTWPSIVTSIYWWYNRKFGDTRKPDGWNVILPQERD